MVSTPLFCYFFTIFLALSFRRHGKVLEEGASGFLAKKFKIEDDKEGAKDNLGKDWDGVNELFQPRGSAEGALFGSAHWASVYLASTPQEAANMGLKLPGVNEVHSLNIGNIF